MNALSKADQAMSHRNAGFNVMALDPDSKEPYGGNGFYDATNEEKRVRQWWVNGPDRNIGIRCDTHNGSPIFVLDIDNKNGKNGSAELEKLEALHGELPETLKVKTTTGGFHRFFYCTNPIRCSVDKIAVGLDIKGENGYVVAAGSTLGDKAYTFVKLGKKIARLPNNHWLYKMARDAAAKEDKAADTTPLPGVDPDRAVKRGMDYLVTAPMSVKGNGGDATAYRVAAGLKDCGCTEAQTLDLMLSPAWYDGCGWSPERLAEKVAHAYRYGKEPPGLKAPEAVFTKVAVVDQFAEAPQWDLDEIKANAGALRGLRLGNPARFAELVQNWDMCSVVTPDEIEALLADKPVTGPRYAGVTKLGVPPSVSNIHQALSHPDECGFRVGFDEFLGDVLVAAPDGGAWRPLTDDDSWSIRRRLETKGSFSSAPKEHVRDGLSAVSRENSFDSAIDWARRLVWDGVPRVDAFATRYLKVDDTPYTRAWSRYVWTALAGRLLVPGIKCDMVPVMVSKEGLRKSSVVAALAPFRDAYAELSLDKKDDDISRLMQGRLVLEWAEMQGLSGRDEQSILAFVTQDTQRWTPKYKERPTQYRRRNVIFGTTNDPDILPTYGAARRWLPIKIREVIDVDAVIRDRDQLWAEGVLMFDHGGIEQANADMLARDERDAFREEDSAEAAVVKWLGEPATDEKGAFVAGRTHGDDPFALGDLLSRLTANNVKHTQKRLTNLLRKLGYDNPQIGGRQDRGRKWVKTDYIE